MISRLASIMSKGGQLLDVYRLLEYFSTNFNCASVGSNMSSAGEGRARTTSVSTRDQSTTYPYTNQRNVPHPLSLQRGLTFLPPGVYSREEILHADRVQELAVCCPAVIEFLVIHHCQVVRLG